MIYAIANVELKPGCRAAYLEVLLSNVAAVKAEKGCLVYEPTIDVETDIPIHEKYGDNFVTIIEAWEDIEALKNHFNEPHMLAYREKAKDLIAMAVAKSRYLESIPVLEVDVTPNALVIGGGIAGMTAALSLADQGFKTYLVEKEEELGGRLKKLHYTIEGMDLDAFLDENIEPEICVCK